MNDRPLLQVQTVSPGGRRPEPRRPLRVRRPRGLRTLDPTLGSAEITGKPFPRTSVEAFARTTMNTVRGTAVHTEAEDGLRVHSRAPHFVQHLFPSFCALVLVPLACPLGRRSFRVARLAAATHVIRTGLHGHSRPCSVYSTALHTEPASTGYVFRTAPHTPHPFHPSKLSISERFPLLCCCFVGESF